MIPRLSHSPKPLSPTEKGLSWLPSPFGREGLDEGFRMPRKAHPLTPSPSPPQRGACTTDDCCEYRIAKSGNCNCARTRIGDREAAAAGTGWPSRVTETARPARPGTPAYVAAHLPRRRTPTRSALLGSVPATSANLPRRLADLCNS